MYVLKPIWTWSPVILFSLYICSSDGMPLPGPTLFAHLDLSLSCSRSLQRSYEVLCGRLSGEHAAGCMVGYKRQMRHVRRRLSALAMSETSARGGGSPRPKASKWLSVSSTMLARHGWCWEPICLFHSACISWLEQHSYLLTCWVTLTPQPPTQRRV
jgi:hypothetical protein